MLGATLRGDGDGSSGGSSCSPVAAAGRAQVVVVSHTPALVEALDILPGARRFTLEKRLGETVVEGAAALEWAWPEQ